MKLKNIFFVLFLSCLLGCGQTDPLNPQKGNNAPTNSVIATEDQEVSMPPKEDAPQLSPVVTEQEQGIVPENDFQPFYVYKERISLENHYVPSGFMPNGKCVSFNDGWMLNCHSGETCVKIIYDIACSNNDQRWAGIYWLNPPNNWGNRKGGFNLTGSQKLVFWAKGEKGGEQIEEFIVGGVMGDFPDSAKITMGPVILTNEWREYTIDLRGRDLSYISGGFGWAANTRANLESCVFYLDDIRFE